MFDERKEPFRCDRTLARNILLNLRSSFFKIVKGLNMICKTAVQLRAGIERFEKVLKNLISPHLLHYLEALTTSTFRKHFNKCSVENLFQQSFFLNHELEFRLLN